MYVIKTTNTNCLTLNYCTQLYASIIFKYYYIILAIFYFSSVTLAFYLINLSMLIDPAHSQWLTHIGS